MGPMPGSGRLPSILLGLCLAVLATVAVTFLGAAAGLTFSTSLPAAFLSLVILTWVLKAGGAAENTFVQTIAATAGAAATAGVFFAPSFLVSDLWTEVPYWTLALTMLGGGLGGILFATHFRRHWEEAPENYPFPESQACAHLLRLSTTKGTDRTPLFLGLGLGLAVKAATALFGALRTAVEGAWAAGRTVFYLGAEVSPALVGVGFLAGAPIATALFLGSAVAWFLLLPKANWDAALSPDPLGFTWLTWNTQLRYLGIGALGVASLWSLYQSRRLLWSGWLGIFTAGSAEPGSPDLSRSFRLSLFAACLGLMGAAAWMETRTPSLAALGAVTALAFLLLAAVSSGTLAAIAGTSLMPVTAMGLGILLSLGPWLRAMAPSFALETLLLLVVFSAAVGGLVSGSLAQSFRIGERCGAPPKLLQLGALLGVITAAFVLPVPLRYLHFAYGVGTGGRAALTPSQSNLFASFAHGIALGKPVPWEWIGLGLKIAVGFILIDEALRVRRSRIRLPIFAVALGMYLPLSVSLPVCLGGWLSRLVRKEPKVSAAAAVASGLIAGEALVGAALGALVVGNPQWVPLRIADSWIVSLAAVVGVAVVLAFFAGKKPEKI